MALTNQDKSKALDTEHAHCGMSRGKEGLLWGNRNKYEQNCTCKSMKIGRQVTITRRQHRTHDPSLSPAQHGTNQSNWLEPVLSHHLFQKNENLLHFKTSKTNSWKPEKLSLEGENSKASLVVVNFSHRTINTRCDMEEKNLWFQTKSLWCVIEKKLHLGVN